MRTVPFAFTLLGLVVLFAFLKQRVKKPTPLAAITKSCVSVCFMATALSATAIYELKGKDLVFAVCIIGGLCCGLLGDIWLDLKYAHREAYKAYTYAGFISFLVGHVVYCTGIVYKYYVKGNSIHIIISLLLIPLAAAFIWFFSEDLLKVKYGEFKLITSVYTGFLLSFFAFSFSMAIINKFRFVELNILIPGSLLFMISDFILCGTYFGKGKSRPVDIIINHLTYYLAQFLIALSLCFMR